MKICVPIPNMRGLLWRHSADIRELVALAEQLLPDIVDPAEYTITVLYQIHLGHLRVKAGDEIIQHSLTGVTVNHLKFAGACRRFYYVEHKFPEHIELCVKDVDLTGSRFVAQRGSYMVVEQG